MQSFASFIVLDSSAETLSHVAVSLIIIIIIIIIIVITHISMSLSRVLAMFDGSQHGGGSKLWRGVY